MLSTNPKIARGTQPAWAYGFFCVVRCVIIPLRENGPTGRMTKGWKRDGPNGDGGEGKMYMENWFSIERLDADTYALSERQHWEETNCYLLLGSKKALLIDTGLGVASIAKAVQSLTQLPVEVVTTHVHWDHIGGHDAFREVAVFEAEAPWLSGQFPMPLPAVKQSLLCKPCNFPAEFDAERYRIYQGGASVLLRDGDTLHLGDRQLRVVHTPGHSPGHICLYEAEREYLFTGDLAYAGCLDAFYPTTDPVLFWRSVRRVRGLPVRHVWPGHHRLHVRVSLLEEIDGAFESLDRSGKLKQGSGLFDFGDFQIHL